MGHTNVDTIAGHDASKARCCGGRGFGTILNLSCAQIKSMLTSKMMCSDALCQPGGALALGLNISKATHTLPISLANTSCYRVFLFIQLALIACFTELGISRPYLWPILQT